MSREKQKNIKPINFSELLTMAQNYKSLILDKKTDLCQTRSFFIEKFKNQISSGSKKLYWKNFNYNILREKNKINKRNFEKNNIVSFEKSSDVSIVINDGVITSNKNLPNNIRITDFKEISDDDACSYIKKTDKLNDPFVSVNNGSCDCGFVLDVKESKSPQIIHIKNISSKAGLYQNRQIYNISKNVKITFIESFEGYSEQFNNTISQWEVKENANVYKYSFGSRAGSHKNSQSVFSEFVEQHKNSTCNFYSFYFNEGGLGFSGKIRNNILFNLIGENITSNQWSVSLLRNECFVDNDVRTQHMSPNCSSSQVYKGIYNDRSKGRFDSCVYVAKDAQKSDTVQSNNNILLNDNASVNSNPQLEIFADDVKCAHGSTIGQIDRNALFYLRARGISEVLAKKLLLTAFVGDIVESINNSDILSLVSEEVEKQFHN
tara:strand:- start:1573 stop:2874 length:1302 start_codon:yes stop_codon:yes gene_type:complete